MVKVDWFNIAYDHIWFSWYLDHAAPGDRIKFMASDGQVYKLFTTGEWADRLWPCRRYGGCPPEWWCRLWKLND